MNEEKELIEIKSVLEMPCQWSVGPLLDKFYAGFENRKIHGTKCPKCKNIYVPPRDVCSDCFEKMGEKDLLEVSGTGKLVNYTVAHEDFRGVKRENPIIIGLIKLEGAHTAVFGEVRNTSPDSVKVGMKLKAVWKDQPKGHVKDMHFEPVSR